MILINMDVPENCNKCPFHDWEYYVCLTPGNGNQNEDVMNYNTARHPKCPLIDIGNPYGIPKCIIGSDTNTNTNTNTNKTPTPFYVVEHEGQHNPITQSFEHIKEAEIYFKKNLSASPILYEVTPIEWVDKTGTKHEVYN